jgi:CheY-like chemotaxis protein
VFFPGAPGAPKPKAEPARLGELDAERKPRILIIEDNETNVDVARLFLQNEYDVEAAFDGESGVRMASEKMYDLILLDINLGEGIDGIETARRIRALDRYDKAPIIALTGYAMAGDREEIFDKGRINDYLAKPFKREDLLQIVEMGLHSGTN